MPPCTQDNRLRDAIFESVAHDAKEVSLAPTSDAEFRALRLALLSEYAPATETERADSIQYAGHWRAGITARPGDGNPALSEPVPVRIDLSTGDRLIFTAGDFRLRLWRPA